MAKPPLSPFLLLAFGLFWTPAAGQEIPKTGQVVQASGPIRYRDGYIVRNGDTIRGSIASADWVMTPQRVGFSRNGFSHDGKAEYFGPRDISAFSVGDVVFRSWTVRIYPYSLDPDVVAAPGWSGAPHDTTVFMEWVTQGRLDLYYYRDSSDVAYFFISEGGSGSAAGNGRNSEKGSGSAAGGPPEQLRIVNKVVRKGASTDVLTENLYQFQLADKVKGCPMIAKRPVDVDYEAGALSRLISTYNHCGRELVETRKGGSRWIIHAGPLVGGLRSSVRISGNTDAAYAGWPAFYAPAGGVGIFAQPSKGQRKWAIQADFLYDHFSLSSHQYHKNYYQRFNARLDYDEIKGNIQVRYIYPMRKVRPFIGAGISNTLTINNKSTQTLSDVGNAQNFRQPLFGSSGSIRMYRPGAFLSLGAQLRRWVLEGRAEQTQGLTGESGIRSSVMNFYVLIGYMF